MIGMGPSIVKHIVTARIRRKGEGTVFSLSVHTWGGGGTILPNGGEGTPIFPNGEGVPHDRGYPGVPLPPSGLNGGIPCQSSRASTCHATGNMPLVFTQEDCCHRISKACLKRKYTFHTRYFYFKLHYRCLCPCSFTVCIACTFK